MVCKRLRFRGLAARLRTLLSTKEEVMAKPIIVDEVQVLRFFESGPIEKAEVVFNIVSEKMRERLQAANRDDDRTATLRLPRKRTGSSGQKASGVESTEPSPEV